ncbi:MAG: MarR family transcriptional regulator [Nitrososphaerota archaeon]|jgi:DNA-binding MarR family transcriptional regulator|nr:MarR family transcriptional regulator [Nitrososphaerota archaeon]
MQTERIVKDTRERTYQSVVATYKVMHKSISKLLAEEGLTQPQFYALRLVARWGPVKMRVLSDELHVTPANVTGIIDRLESRGLLKRRSHAGDRRSTLLELTQTGLALESKVRRRYGQFVQDALDKLTEREQDLLSTLLQKLQKEMSDLAAKKLKYKSESKNAEISRSPS